MWKEKLLLSISVLVLVLSPAIAGKLDLDEAFLLLATQRTSTMQSELNQASEAGYRVIAGSATRDCQLAYLLEYVGESLGRDHYLLLATKRLATMERELNATASKGYRLLPRSLLYDEEELILLMERTLDPSTPHYVVLGTHRTSTLQNEINDWAERGYRPAAFVATDENVVILERR